MSVLGWNESFGSHEFDITLRGQFNRIPGPYDGDDLEDLINLSFRYIKTFDNDVDLALSIDNVLDEQVEVLPGYDNRGRQIMLTVQKKW
jgi:outer membrane receptor protein involved in Fe transport